MQSVKRGAEPFLIERPDNRHRFHLAVDGGHQPQNPTHKHRHAKKRDAGQDKAAKEWNDHENECARPDDDPSQDKAEHLPEMIRAKLGLFVAVNDGGGDEADQRDVGDDCDRLVFTGGRRRIDCGRRGIWIVHGSFSFGLMFWFVKNDGVNPIPNPPRVK